MKNQQISPHTISLLGLGFWCSKNLHDRVLPTFSVPYSQVCENSVNICHHELTSSPFDNVTSQVLSC